MTKKPLLLFCIAATFACTKATRKPVDDRVPVTVAAVASENLPSQIRVVGNVEPMKTVAIRALVGGQLTHVWFREGDDIHRDQLLFTIDPRPYQAALAQAEANLARDLAQLHNAESDASRYADLVKKDYVTKEEYEKRTSDAEAGRAVVAADRAAVENSRLQLSYCEIHAPLDGRTGSLQVHEGNLVKANDTTPLVVINQVKPIYVQFAVPERQLSDVRSRFGAGSPVNVTAAPQGGGAAAAGRLSFVDNAVDPQTGTITLKATFPNDNRALWPGQFVNVAVTVAERPNAIVVPAQAVQNGQNGQFIYVVNSDNSVQMRPVEIAEQIDELAIVRKGVSAGETVVTDGQLRLTPKSKVEIKKQL